MGGWCKEESFSDYTVLYGSSLSSSTCELQSLPSRLASQRFYANFKQEDSAYTYLGISCIVKYYIIEEKDLGFKSGSTTKADFWNFWKVSNFAMCFNSVSTKSADEQYLCAFPILKTFTQL